MKPSTRSFGLALLLALLGLPTLTLAQGGAPRGRPEEENLRVFLDCQRCDFDYFREEVPFVNYVRDRVDARLHVLVTQQQTGAGGFEYTFHFIGLGLLEAQEDTLQYTSLPDETDDETRAGMVRAFKLGLVPYVSSTPLGRRLDVRYEGPRGMPTEEEAADPWNLWVFEARVSGEVSGESRSSDRSFDGSFGANRTTEEFKVDLSVRGDYSEEKFEFSNGEEHTSTSQNHELEGTAVWSLGPKWSWGLTGSATVSTRLNQDMAARLGPAVEYNIYPYSESTRRQITFFYTVEAATFDYEEITLFDRTSETRVEQTLEASAAFEQPWGEIDASVEWSNYLDDFEQHRLDFSTRLEIRLFRGLSLDLEGSAARVKNQIYEPREDIPDEDVLLERRQLGTDFEYSFDIGFSYTFGSMFNNAVNPRMSRGRRGGDWGGHD
ncbi:hypothetical protein ACFL5A_01610 [Gemmatimonadota bacterium]